MFQFLFCSQAFYWIHQGSLDGLKANREQGDQQHGHASYQKNISTDVNPKGKIL